MRSAGGPIHLPLEFPNTIGVAGVRLKLAERARRHADLCGVVPYKIRDRGLYQQQDPAAVSRSRTISPCRAHKARLDALEPVRLRTQTTSLCLAQSPEQLSSRSRTRSSSSSINGPTIAGHLKSPDRAPRHEVYAQAGLFGRCVRRILTSFAPVQSAP